MAPIMKPEKPPTRQPTSLRRGSSTARSVLAPSCLAESTERPAAERGTASARAGVAAPPPLLPALPPPLLPPLSSCCCWLRAASDLRLLAHLLACRDGCKGRLLAGRRAQVKAVPKAGRASEAQGPLIIDQFFY